MPPLLEHTSAPIETHYFALLQHDPHHDILLHSHASGPFVRAPLHGFNLTIHAASPGCAPASLHLSVSWWGTLGRWGTRYAQAVIAWAVGVVALAVHRAWAGSASALQVPSVGASLGWIARRWLVRMLGLSIVLSLVPLPAGMWLGNVGEPVLAGLAPLLLLVVFGLVCVSWAVVNGVLVVVSRALSCMVRRPTR